MNSDCIILELLDGVGKLKEEVTNLRKGPRERKSKYNPRAVDYGIKKKSKTDEVAEYITCLKERIVKLSNFKNTMIEYFIV